MRVHQPLAPRRRGGDEGELAPRRHGEANGDHLVLAQRHDPQAGGQLAEDGDEEDARVADDGEVAEVAHGYLEADRGGEEDLEQPVQHALHLLGPRLVHVVVGAEAEAGEESAEQVRRAERVAERHQADGEAEHLGRRGAVGGGLGWGPGVGVGARVGVGVGVGVAGVAASHGASESFLPPENLPPPETPASQLQLAMLAVADAAI